MEMLKEFIQKYKNKIYTWGSIAFLSVAAVVSVILAIQVNILIKGSIPSQRILLNDISNSTVAIGAIFFSLLTLLSITARYFEKKYFRWEFAGYMLLAISLGISILWIVYSNILLTFNLSALDYISILVGLNVFSAILLLFIIINVMDYLRTYIKDSKDYKYKIQRKKRQTSNIKLSKIFKRT